MSSVAPPKSTGKRQAQAALALAEKAAAPTGLLDAFPVWQDQAAVEKEAPGMVQHKIHVPGLQTAFFFHSSTKAGMHWGCTSS